MNRSIITMYSMTAATHATRVLEGNGIRSSIVRLPPKYSKNGCAYGIELSKSSTEQARHILRVSDIKYGTVIDGI